MSNSQSSSNRRRRLILAQNASAGGVGTLGPAINKADAPAGRFLAACGASSSLSVVVSDGSRTRPVTVSKPYLLVGSSRRCDVRLAHQSIGPQHLYLQVVDGRLYCCALSSGAEGLGPGEQNRTGWMRHDDCLHVGPYTITPPDSYFSGTGDEPQSETTPPPAAADRPAVALEFPNTRGARPLLLKRRVTLVGRGEVCKIRIPQQSVSEAHASLVRTASGLWVVDLLGGGDTLLEGRPVQFARIQDGQELQIGTTLIRVRYRPPEAAGPVSQPARPKQPQSLQHRGEAARQPAASKSGEESPPEPSVELSVHSPQGLSEEFVLSLVDRLQAQSADSLRAISAHNQNQELLSSVLAALGEAQREQAGLLRHVIGRMDLLTDECRDIRRRLAEGSGAPLDEPRPAIESGPPAADVADRRPPRRIESTVAPLPAGASPTAAEPAAAGESATGRQPPSEPAALQQSGDPQAERDAEWLRERLLDVEEMLARERRGLLRRIFRV